MAFKMQFYRLQTLFISMKICIVVTDGVMMLLESAEKCYVIEPLVNTSYFLSRF